MLSVIFKQSSPFLINFPHFFQSKKCNRPTNRWKKTEQKTEQEKDQQTAGHTLLQKCMDAYRYLKKSLREFIIKQRQIHVYISRVQLGRGSNKSLQASIQQNLQGKNKGNGPTDRRTDSAADQPT